MNKKVLTGAGLLTLTIAAALVGRASAKFANATALYVSTAAGCHALNATFTSSSKFTTVNGIRQATLKTNGGGTRKVWGSSTCGTGASPKPIYFYP